MIFSEFCLCVFISDHIHSIMYSKIPLFIKQIWMGGWANAFQCRHITSGEGRETDPSSPPPPTPPLYFSQQLIIDEHSVHKQDPSKPHLKTPSLDLREDQIAKNYKMSDCNSGSNNKSNDQQSNSSSTSWFGSWFQGRFVFVINDLLKM